MSSGQTKDSGEPSILPRRILRTATRTLLVLVLLVAAIAAWNRHQFNMREAEREEQRAYREANPDWNAPDPIDFSTGDSSEDLMVGTYQSGEDLYGNARISIYDSAYNSLFFDSAWVTADDLHATLSANDNIPDDFRWIIEWYIDAVTKAYPQADLRPFEYNLRTLRMLEMPRDEFEWETLSFNAGGCYIRTENAIYLPEGYELEPGTWDWQVIVHELSHCLRTVWRGGASIYTSDGDALEVEGNEGLNLRVQAVDPSGPLNGLTTPEECLNSLFAVSLFDYEERDIAYQLQSNMYLAMISCMDNYDLSDYVNHSVEWFCARLDETNGDHNRAAAILRLIDVQREDHLDTRDPREQTEYYPIYHYLVDMWLARNARAGMDDAEVGVLIDGLLDVVMYDVPEDYNIDTDEFYRYAHERYAQMTW